MRSFSTTFRRKWFDPSNENDKGTPYGDKLEKVESGPNKGQEVPCILVENDTAPENYEELAAQLKDDSNFTRFVDWVFKTGITEEIRKFTNKQKIASPNAEATEHGRREYITRVKEIARTFTLSGMFAEAITATAAIDSLSSTEMAELGRRAQAGDIQAGIEFARRTMELLQNTK